MAGKIDIIVPVYNEEEGIEEFLQRIQNLPMKFNLIVVDNASTDGTVDILQKYKDITIIRHDRNAGYGASICDGISHSKGEIIVIIDADCEYPPESVPELVKRLEKSDVVYASRFLESAKVQMPRLKRIGNKIITAAFNALFHQKVTDLYTGCKALRRSALEGITLRRRGFEHVLEMGVQLSKKRIHIDEIFVRFAARRTGYSKMRHVSETVKFLYLILWYRFCTKAWKQ
jgi:glycosyltransferase involved in cell wall biosynthesis